MLFSSTREITVCNHCNSNLKWKIIEEKLDKLFIELTTEKQLLRKYRHDIKYDQNKHKAPI